jgi:hypothetical protein
MTVKKVKYRHLVSLNTASIRLRSKHPRIAEDLKEILEFLKEKLSEDRERLYQSDGLLDLDD